MAPKHIPPPRLGRLPGCRTGARLACCRAEPCLACPCTDTLCAGHTLPVSSTHSCPLACCAGHAPTAGSAAACCMTWSAARPWPVASATPGRGSPSLGPLSWRGTCWRRTAPARAASACRCISPAAPLLLLLLLVLVVVLLATAAARRQVAAPLHAAEWHAWLGAARARGVASISSTPLSGPQARPSSLTSCMLLAWAGPSLAPTQPTPRPPPRPPNLLLPPPRRRAACSRWSSPCLPARRRWQPTPAPPTPAATSAPALSSATTSSGSTCSTATTAATSARRQRRRLPTSGVPRSWLPTSSRTTTPVWSPSARVGGGGGVGVDAARGGGGRNARVGWLCCRGAASATCGGLLLLLVPPAGVLVELLAGQAWLICFEVERAESNLCVLACTHMLNAASPLPPAASWVQSALRPLRPWMS